MVLHPVKMLISHLQINNLLHIDEVLIMEKFFKSWVNFDEMITPKIIVVIYWILMAITVLGSFVTMFTGNFVSFLFGVVSLIFGIIGVRVGCELVILSFNIYKTLKKISDNQNKNIIDNLNENQGE